MGVQQRIFRFFLCACVEYIDGLEAEGGCEPKPSRSPHRILRFEIEVKFGMKELLAMHTFCATVLGNLGEEMETNKRDK